ncbi:MAG: hypothetical protein FJ033_13540 [Chloroflexi bacterium]|nr:hypothetical protein [Chloroflexota bacterium]
MRASSAGSVVPLASTQARSSPNAGPLSRRSPATGFLAAIDDIVIGDRVAHLLAETAGSSFRFVMLMPGPEVVRRREEGRGTRLWEHWDWMDDEIRRCTWRIGLWIDTSDQTPAETEEAILARWDEAVIPR